MGGAGVMGTGVMGGGNRGGGNRGRAGFALDLHCAILKDILRKIWNEHYNL